MWLVDEINSQSLSGVRYAVEEEFVFLGDLPNFEHNLLGKVRTLDFGSRWRPFGVVFYCGDCGRVWGGRLPCSGPKRFYYLNRECQAHGDSSFLDSGDELSSMSETLIKYELQIFKPLPREEYFQWLRGLTSKE